MRTIWHIQSIYSIVYSLSDTVISNILLTNCCGFGFTIPSIMIKTSNLSHIFCLQVSIFVLPLYLFVGTNLSWQFIIQSLIIFIKWLYGHTMYLLILRSDSLFEAFPCIFLSISILHHLVLILVCLSGTISLVSGWYLRYTKHIICKKITFRNWFWIYTCLSTIYWHFMHALNYCCIVLMLL